MSEDIADLLGTIGDVALLALIGLVLILLGIGLAAALRG